VKFDAVVAPKINASVSSPHFPKICQLFKSHKLNLADHNLGDDGRVDILLGLNGSSQFSVASFPLGNSKSSVQVFNSPAGLMLAGDMTDLTQTTNFDKLNNFLSRVNLSE